MAGPGLAGQGEAVKSRRGVAGLGKAVEARLGQAWRGLARLAKQEGGVIAALRPNRRVS